MKAPSPRPKGLTQNRARSSANSNRAAGDLRRDARGRLVGPGEHELLDGARRLLDWLDERGVDTQTLGRGRYEQARRASGLAGVPSADALRRRFGIALAEVLRLAALSPNRRTARLGSLRSAAGQFQGEDDQILRALRAAALGVEGPLTGVAYDAWAAAQARRPRRGHRLVVLHPSSRTIINRLGSWEAACRAAGVDAPPAYPRRRARPSEELLSLAIDRLGAVPPWHYLVAFWRREGVSVARIHDYTALIARVTAMRAADGRWTPTRVTPATRLPTLHHARRPRRRGQGSSYEREQILASLRLYATLAGPGVPHRVRHYKALRRVHPELIPPNAIAGHGRFQHLLREALADAGERS